MLCLWCEGSIKRKALSGTKPKYCSTRCRQQAWHYENYETKRRRGVR